MTAQHGPHGEYMGGHGDPRQPEEFQDDLGIRDALFDNVQISRARLVRVGTELVSIGNSDVRNNPDFQAAVQAVISAELAIDAFHGIQQVNN